MFSRAKLVPCAGAALKKLHWVLRFQHCLHNGLHEKLCYLITSKLIQYEFIACQICYILNVSHAESAAATFEPACMKYALDMYMTCTACRSVCTSQEFA
jgi:hypothetical protein